MCLFDRTLTLKQEEKMAENTVEELLKLFQADIPEFVSTDIVNIEDGMSVGGGSIDPNFDSSVASAYYADVTKAMIKAIEAIDPGLETEDIQSNISVSIEHLLLEASRIKDESERKYQEAEKNAENGNLNKFLQKLLNELNNCDGLCCLDTKTDEIISLANSDKYGLDKLTRDISTTNNKDGKSFTGDILITTDKSYLVITRIDDTDYWISVILLKPANIGLNHLLISKHKPLLAQILINV